jgi:hypothetical protein
LSRFDKEGDGASMGGYEKVQGGYGKYQGTWSVLIFHNLFCIFSYLIFILKLNVGFQCLAA